ncbi:ImmA/IrrE family metallo-endopeptidase [Patescibacteria group bacterium]|nr:ImmA/IrrE family metallo-endopeptidase [Patescibacteria group bacterium]
MPSPDYKKAEDAADALVKEFHYEEPFVNVFEIALRKGLRLKEYDPDEKAVLQNAAGFFDPDTKTIYVNKEDPPNRKTFTVAHELGHFLLEHKPSEYGVLPRWQTPGEEKEAIEKEADAFAANLLVPKSILKNVMSKYGLTKEDTSVLAKMFGVSEVVIRYRVKHI